MKALNEMGVSLRTDAVDNCIMDEAEQGVRASAGWPRGLATRQPRDTARSARSPG